jgi:hypothetical protein
MSGAIGESAIAEAAIAEGPAPHVVVTPQPEIVQFYSGGRIGPFRPIHPPRHADVRHYRLEEQQLAAVAGLTGHPFVSVSARSRNPITIYGVRVGLSAGSVVAQKNLTDDELFILLEVA